MELLMTEVITMDTLSHPNIVNIITFNTEGVVKKTNREPKPVIYIVLELAQGGELFGYVANTGRFDERTSRLYFNQLIAGLDYVH
jgi:serine/threonine protein kinase